MNKISISVVTYNNSDKISSLLSSIIAHTKKYDYKIYVIDNNSSDDTVKIVKDNFPSVTVIENSENKGFGWGHNRVLNELDSEFHAVINPDVILSQDSLSYLADYIESNPGIVMATPKIINPDGSEQYLPKKDVSLKYLIGSRFEQRGEVFKKLREDYTMKNLTITDCVDIGFCTGCFFMIKTDVYKKLGGFDERFFMYFEDADLTQRASKIGRVVYTPQFEVTHLWERASSKKIKLFLIELQSMAIYFMKYPHWKEKG
ncbi:MAG: glycosyltransferase family 2 protein [Bacillota bacterium]|nr:glycosyltransferase family 2 protein [Bacillota bacterium]